MSAELFLALPFQQIPTLTGDRLIRLQNIWGAGDVWPNLHTANHNIFRLGANQRVVWQVRRVENPTHANWKILHEMARAENPEVEGYLDPFFNMTLDERGALEPEPVGIYRPGCKVYLTTHDWLYELDVETGIATCTGDQVK